MHDGMNSLKAAYEGKTVLVTGHTGFKGAWLCEWLLMLGARVVGIALPPNTEPSLFEQLGIAQRVEHHIVDIRDREALAKLIVATEPDYLFHLAAQPLVRQSYVEPVETYEVNIMGTVHVLDALRQLGSHYEGSEQRCASVLVTTDKCYENREWDHGYREEDALGGYDPYSSSKAAAELAIAAYRRSYFNPQERYNTIRIGIASARAGNVIGGGDWAEDRIVPDCMLSLSKNETIRVRNAGATRPWQHVLECLSGYLLLAARQREALVNQEQGALEATCASYNFGPALTANQTVGLLVERILEHWPGQWVKHAEDGAPHEAGKLNLAWDKAFHQLGWHPQWDFDETVHRTVAWYREKSAKDADATALTREDIEAYMDANS